MSYLPVESRMDPDLKARWVAALRGGEYQQAKGRLKCREGFCCLGVLREIEPSIQQADDEDQLLHPETPALGRFRVQETLAQLNDDGFSFNELADIIEAEL